jgi:hypothetical protein
MTIAGKINALVLAITAFLGALATGFLADREFRIQRDTVVEQTLSLAEGLPELQVDLYFQDKAGMDRSLRRFLEPSPVSYVVLYSPSGVVMAQHSRAAPAASALPPFSLLRNQLGPSEVAQTVLDGDSHASGRSPDERRPEDSPIDTRVFSAQSAGKKSYRS